MSRNALGNLANRYRAVLKKCHLLNILAGSCVLPLPQGVGAVDLNTIFDGNGHRGTI